METKRLVGIISTILLIANYISTAVINSLFDVSDQFLKTYGLIAVLISFAGIIGLYYAVSRYLKQHNYKVENILIISVIFIKPWQLYFGLFKISTTQYHISIHRF